MTALSRSSLKEGWPKRGYMSEEVCGFLKNFFRHSEGWTPRNEALMEAVVKQMRTTTLSWLIACDANMCPEDFKKSLCFKSKHMLSEAPGQGVSTCISKGAKGEFIEITYHHVIASRRLQGRIKKMEVVEDFESRPHKAVTFMVKRESSR